MSNTNDDRLRREPQQYLAMQELLQSSIRARQWNDAHSACDRLEAMAQDDVQTQDAKLRRAELLCAKGSIREALLAIRQAVPDGQVLGAAMAVAQAASADGAQEQAAQLLDAATRQVAAAGGDDRTALIARLNVAATERRLEEAQELLSQLRSMPGGQQDSGLALWECELLARQGRVEEAVDGLRRALGAEQFLRRLATVAQGMAERGAVEASIALHERMGQMQHDERGAAWERAGDLWRDKLGRCEEACRAYERSLEAEPQRRSALVELLRTRIRAWQWEMADAACDRLEAMAQDQAQRQDAGLRRAEVLCARGSVDEALQVIREHVPAEQVFPTARKLARTVAEDNASAHADSLVRKAFQVATSPHGGSAGASRRR